jgi:hypothetical protein
MKEMNTMRIAKIYIALGLMIAFGLFFELAAHADETNEQTTITFNAPIQIPGHVLPAGTYIFQQAEPDFNQNLVQIFNADRTVLYAQLQTASAERAEATGQPAVTLAAPRTGGPEVLVNWFYPGSLTGHEFVYPKQQEQEIAGGPQKTFVGDRLVHSADAVGD